MPPYFHSATFCDHPTRSLPYAHIPVVPASRNAPPPHEPSSQDTLLRVASPLQNQPRAGDSQSDSPSRASPSLNLSPRARRPASRGAARSLCPMPFCARSYARAQDLIRHLATAHHAQLGAADDALLAVMGVPVEHIARLRTLMARQNRCAMCGAVFPRRDTLLRHLDEQAHWATQASEQAPAALAPLYLADGAPGWPSEALPRAASPPLLLQPTETPLSTAEPAVAEGDHMLWDLELVRLVADSLGLFSSTV